MWQTISDQISKATGNEFQIESQRSVGGGSINAAYIISQGQNSFFVKTNSASRVDMFEAERDGLNEITASDSIKVPQAICVGSEGSSAFIVMECLSIGRLNASSQSLGQLGFDLANMHRCTKQHYGWYRDNTIGSTPQINEQENDWIDFYRDKRLGYQYGLAAKRGCGKLADKGELLMSKLEGFFTDYNPPASLLHGDLWSGNYAIEENGTPVIFDPATYYGDREADIAMTELFGGFSQRFYSAYNDAYPLDDGYRTRKVLYNLYHIINHFNLFGGGYQHQAENMTEQLLAEL